MSTDNSNDKEKIEKIDLDQLKIDIHNDSKAPLGIPSNIKLGEDQFNDLQTEIEDMIDAVEDDSGKSELVDILEENERMLRSEFDTSKSKPWSTSSEAESTMPVSHTYAISNSITRTLTVEPYVMVKGPGDKEAKYILQDFMNDRARFDFDYEEFIRDLAQVATQTPLAIINPVWKREVRRDTDYEVFTTMEGYKAKYPNAEAAGLTEVQYKSEIKTVSKNILVDKRHEAVVEFDRIIKNGVHLNVIHPSDFGMFPFNARRIDLAKGVWHKEYMTFDDIKRMEADGILLEGTAQKVKEAFEQSQTDDDQIKAAQEAPLGVDSANYQETYNTKIYPILKGVIRQDFHDEGYERDYEFFFAFDECILMRFAKTRTHTSKRPYIAATIRNNTKSIFGVSVPQMIRNPSEVVSTLKRQTLDSNTIANVPTFKANFADKQWFERTYQTMKFEPGKTFWMRNPGNFESFQTKAIDISAQLRLIQFEQQEAEMVDGASRSLFGQPLPEDPEAPGVKTAMLLQQSNFTVNQFIKNLIPSIEEAFDYARYLYKQYLPIDETITVDRVAVDGSRKPQSVSRDDIPLLVNDFKVSVRPQRVDDNQQMRLQNARADIELLMAFPEVQTNPFAKRILMRNYMMQRDSFTLDEMNEITSEPMEIAQTILSAQQDVQTAQKSRQEAEGLNQQVQSDADVIDEETTNQLSDQAGGEAPLA